MLLLGHRPALVGADARLFELRPVAGIDGSPSMGHRVGSCAFLPMILSGSAIPIISVLQTSEEALRRRVVRGAALARHRADEAVLLAYRLPTRPSVVAPTVGMYHRGLSGPKLGAGLLQRRVREAGVRARPRRPSHRPAVEEIYDRREVDLSGTARQLELGDVRDPLLVRGGGREVVRAVLAERQVCLVKPDFRL